MTFKLLTDAALRHDVRRVLREDQLCRGRPLHGRAQPRPSGWGGRRHPPGAPGRSRGRSRPERTDAPWAAGGSFRAESIRMRGSRRAAAATHPRREPAGLHSLPDACREPETKCESPSLDRSRSPGAATGPSRFGVGSACRGRVRWIWPGRPGGAAPSADGGWPSPTARSCVVLSGGLHRMQAHSRWSESSQGRRGRESGRLVPPSQHRAAAAATSLGASPVRFLIDNVLPLHMAPGLQERL